MKLGELQQGGVNEACKHSMRKEPRKGRLKETRERMLIKEPLKGRLMKTKDHAAGGRIRAGGASERKQNAKARMPSRSVATPVRSDSEQGEGDLAGRCT